MSENFLTAVMEKPIASAETEGFVKLIFDKDTDELLGGHIVGYDAAELLGEVALAKSRGLKAKDIIKSIHFSSDVIGANNGKCCNCS